MKNIGFIGTGSMGSLLIESFIKAGTDPAAVHMINRNRLKAARLQSKFPDSHVHETLQTLTRFSDRLFICTKPAEMIPVIKELNHLLRPDQTVITITSPLLPGEAESLLTKHHNPVCRFIPSVVNFTLSGPSLVTYGARCSRDLKEELWELFSTISRPVEIEPSVTRVASDLASCGPAFLSFLIQNMVAAAVEERGIDLHTASEITESMVSAYGEILKDKDFNLDVLQKRVTVPGGVTGEGLKVLNSETGEMFHKMFRKTEEKYQKDRKHIISLLN